MSTAKKSNAESKSAGNKPTISKPMNKTSNLASFLKTHLIKKDDTQKSTNTRIPDPKTNTYGGKYYIPITDCP